jgi:hypothetical protein
MKKDFFYPPPYAKSGFLNDDGRLRYFSELRQSVRQCRRNRRNRKITVNHLC